MKVLWLCNIMIPVIAEITPEVIALAGGKGSALGTGGMCTKLSAAQMATANGTDMIIANGANPELLYAILDGEAVGTRFLSRKD